MPKSLGSAKVEGVGQVAPTKGTESTQVGRLSQSQQPEPTRLLPLVLTDSGETSEVGQYQVRGILGRGGMGVVYDVVDRQTGSVYALKTIETRFLVLPESNAAQRFQQEISVLERLDHPSVVRLFDSGFAHHPLGYDLAFFVMERLDGDTLDRDMKAGKIFEVDESIETMVQLLDALDYLAEHGVLHRDIKPGNVFREIGGRVVLMDFGLARSEEFTRLTLAGQIVGTFGYMSPERLTGRAFEISADVFALGVVFFQMLAGYHPFNAPSPTETLEAIKRGLSFPPNFTDVQHGEEVKAIISSMLSYAAADRPTPARLREQLGALLGDGGVARARRQRAGRKGDRGAGRAAAARSGKSLEDRNALPVTTPATPRTAPTAAQALASEERRPEPVVFTVQPTTPRVPLTPSPKMPSAPAASILSPEGLLTGSGPTWAVTGLLTIAAACVAFLAGLLVGRSQREAPVAAPPMIVQAAPLPTPVAAQPDPPLPKLRSDPIPEAPPPPPVEQTIPPSAFHNADAAFAYGVQLIEREQYQAAAGILERALDLNPAHPSAHRRLGDAYAGLGDVDRAKKHYKAYLALKPSAPDAPEVRRLERSLRSR